MCARDFEREADRDSSFLIVAIALILCGIWSCKSESAPPPSATQPSSSSAADATSSAPSRDGLSPSNVEGPRAQWIDVAGTKSTHVEPCSIVFVEVARGKISLGDIAPTPTALETTDVAVITRPHAMHMTLQGNGLALVAGYSLEGDACTSTTPNVVTISGKNTAKLTWAHGAMSAWLDVGADVSKSVYVGRLEGTAPVAEHVHAGSWEILAPIDASGTLVIDGIEKHVHPRDIVVIPPNTKHEWKPDPGSTLRAVQIYSPRGPEERFKKLAAAEASSSAAQPPN